MRSTSEVQDVGISGVLLHRLELIKDLSGSLSVGEFAKDIPFLPKRYFLVFDVPSKETRGNHAHRVCHQFLICVSGQCSVIVDDGSFQKEILLDKVTNGLYLPPMIWGIQRRYDKNAVLLVFASHHYDPDDYIRDYDEFLREIKKHGSSSYCTTKEDSPLSI